MRRVSIYRQLFVFSTEADFAFPKPFLSAGARSAPFDREESRLIYEPIVIHAPIAMVTSNVTYVANLSYVISRFFNSLMLWHTAFDFLVPAFHTFAVVEGPAMSPERRVFIRDHEHNAYPQLLRSISVHPITFLFHDNVTRTFARVVVGLAKLERNPSAARNGDAMLSIHYDFRVDTALTLRSEVFRALAMPLPVLDANDPIVIIIERAGTARRFLNIDEVEQFMMSRCDFCDIRRVDFAQLTVEDQIKVAASALVLVGVHGSGLSHVLWMESRSNNAPTAMIEVMPHQYKCRDWFHGAADVARIKYYEVMSGSRGVNPNLTEKELARLRECWQRPEWCPTAICHDILRDQNISLEIGSFSSVWMEVVNDLKNARRSKR
jgi:hypothetical protein